MLADSAIRGHSPHKWGYSWFWGATLLAPQGAERVKHIDVISHPWVKHNRPYTSHFVMLTFFIYFHETDAVLLLMIHKTNTFDFMDSESEKTKTYPCFFEYGQSPALFPRSSLKSPCLSVIWDQFITKNLHTHMPLGLQQVHSAGHWLAIRLDYLEYNNEGGMVAFVNASGGGARVGGAGGGLVQ